MIPLLLHTSGNSKRSGIKADHLYCSVSLYSTNNLFCSTTTSREFSVCNSKFLLEVRKRFYLMDKNYVILVLFGVLSVMTGVEAGCNYNGCCYCHKYNGHVITHGEYAVDCDIGCKYNFCYKWTIMKFYNWNIMLIIIIIPPIRFVQM